LRKRREPMTEPLKTYSIRVKFWSDHRYPESITAPSKEEAIKLWLEENLDVRDVTKAYEFEDKEV